MPKEMDVTHTSLRRWFRRTALHVCQRRAASLVGLVVVMVTVPAHIGEASPFVIHVSVSSGGGHGGSGSGSGSPGGGTSGTPIAARGPSIAPKSAATSSSKSQVETETA